MVTTAVAAINLEPLQIRRQRELTRRKAVGEVPEVRTDTGGYYGLQDCLYRKLPKVRRALEM